MVAEYTKEEVERLLTAPIILAARHKRELLPVVGAGLSLPLSVPSWQSLCEELTLRTGIIREEGEDAPQWLERIRTTSPPRYFDNIRALLDGPSDRTTRALQALATSRVGVMATLNLDYSIETAFELAKKPLKPHRVSYNAVEIAPDVRNPQLIKLHGSLENTETWILTQSDYNSWYFSDSPKLKQWWETLVWRPFFIGCGMDDHDIKAIIRGWSHRNQRSGFMVLSLQEARKHEAELRRIGITPVAVATFDSLCEVIDEVFGCEQLLIEECKQPISGRRIIRIGATELECHGLGGPEEDICRKTIANLVKVQTTNPLAGQSLGRRGGENNAGGVAAIVALAKLSDGWIWFKSMAEALYSYADVYSQQLIASLCRSPETAMELWPKVLKNLGEAERKQAVSIIQCEFDSVIDFNLKKRKLLANVLARDLKLHEGISMPPTLTRVGIGAGLHIMPFHLTVGQAEILLAQQWDDRTNPLKPFVLQSPWQLAEIVNRLEKLTPGSRWRLPTVSEWQKIARQGTSWPWGNDPPRPGLHANLKYVEQGSGRDPVLRPVPGIPQGGPTEVGLFLPGKSRTGLFDLIGNVYDLVWTADRPELSGWQSLLQRMDGIRNELGENEDSRNRPLLIILKGYLKLAGGAFTSSYIDGSKSKVEDMSEVGNIAAGNIGIRLVCEEIETGRK
jgi:hypothetical protein